MHTQARLQDTVLMEYAPDLFAFARHMSHGTPWDTMTTACTGISILLLELSTSAKSIEYVLLICRQKHPVIAAALTVFGRGASALLPIKVLRIAPASPLSPAAPFCLYLGSTHAAHSKAAQDSAC